MKNRKIKRYKPYQFLRLLACYNRTILAWKINKFDLPIYMRFEIEIKQ